MDQDQVMTRLSDLFREVFDDPDLVISASTTADDIPGWDSMTHINLIVGAEQAFGIRFGTAEMEGMHDVGELARLIAAKTGARAAAG
jgi:acyl carrier protein